MLLNILVYVNMCGLIYFMAETKTQDMVCYLAVCPFQGHFFIRKTTHFCFLQFCTILHAYKILYGAFGGLYRQVCD